MNTDKTYIGSTKSKIKWRKKNIPLFVGIWFACIIFAYVEHSFRPIIIISIPSVISIIFSLPIFEGKIYIKVNNGLLSIHSKNAIFWSTQLKNITSIELEESKRLIPLVARKSILIRNNKNDSYFLPLDSIDFDGLNPGELVEELNKIAKEIS